MIDTNLGALTQVHYIIGHGRFHKLNIKQLSKAPFSLVFAFVFALEDFCFGDFFDKIIDSMDR